MPDFEDKVAQLKGEIDQDALKTKKEIEELLIKSEMFLRGAEKGDKLEKAGTETVSTPLEPIATKRNLLKSLADFVKTIFNDPTPLDKAVEPEKERDKEKEEKEKDKEGKEESKKEEKKEEKEEDKKGEDKEDMFKAMEKMLDDKLSVHDGTAFIFEIGKKLSGMVDVIAAGYRNIEGEVKLLRKDMGDIKTITDPLINCGKSLKDIADHVATVDGDLKEIRSKTGMPKGADLSIPNQLQDSRVAPSTGYNTKGAAVTALLNKGVGILDTNKISLYSGLLHQWQLYGTTDTIPEEISRPFETEIAEKQKAK